MPVKKSLSTSRIVGCSNLMLEAAYRVSEIMSSCCRKAEKRLNKGRKMNGDFHLPGLSGTPDFRTEKRLNPFVTHCHATRIDITSDKLSSE